jgi:hypothetical protein
VKHWEKRGTCSDAVLREILDYGVMGENYPFASGKSWGGMNEAMT